MKAYRQNGNLVIEVEEAALISVAVEHHGAKLTDREKFLNYVAENVLDFGTHDHEYLNQLLDDVIEEAEINEEGVTQLDNE